MHKKDYCYSENEKVINKVLVSQDKTMTSIESTLNDNVQKLNESISLAEDTLKSLGMGKEVVLEKNKIRNSPSKKKIYILRNWDSIIEETEKQGYDLSWAYELKEFNTELFRDLKNFNKVFTDFCFYCNIEVPGFQMVI